MKIGEVFFVADKSIKNMRSYICQVGKKLDRRFSVHSVYAIKTKVGYELAEKGDRGAAVVIGVWRDR